MDSLVLWLKKQKTKHNLQYGNMDLEAEILKKSVCFSSFRESLHCLFFQAKSSLISDILITKPLKC